MDKNTIIGLLLIFAILIGFSIFNKNDVPPETQTQKIETVKNDTTVQSPEVMTTKASSSFSEMINDTTKLAVDTLFGNNDNSGEKDIILENEKIKITLSTKGGKITDVQLKEYRTHDSLPLMLWTKQHSSFAMKMSLNHQATSTENFIFTPSQTQEGDNEIVSMTLAAGGNKSIVFRYTLPKDSYMVDFSIITNNMETTITDNPKLAWMIDMQQLEKSKEFENRYTGLYYKYFADDVESLSMTSSSKETEELTSKVKWIAVKQQFFSSVLIAKSNFPTSTLTQEGLTEKGYLKKVSAEMPLEFSMNANQTFDFQFFFGPNSYPILRDYGADIELPGLVNLGWKWLAWINRYVVIPIFSFLESKVTQNYGLIILLLTLIIKIILSPLTYKSYLSQAKMRILKPQIQAINDKIPADKAMERQQATMKLYKQAGVNPMGGCLPMLIQFPILIALFWFFPGAIELRQKSFLWADDLASYDSIATLPFSIPFYGSHVSLFCLLMTVTNIIYTWMNSKNQVQNEQMKGMNTMMYLMPIMFLFIFNSYSAGLSYYYFIATLITILQTWIIRKFVINDATLLKKMEAAKLKPVKKSRFQQRLEEMQKMQQQRLKEQQKNNRK